MYTKKELAYASKIISRVARENNVTEAQVRSDIQEAMDIGRRNTDPIVQASWSAFHYSGVEPTVEEFILWAASQMDDVKLKN